MGVWGDPRIRVIWLEDPLELVPNRKKITPHSPLYLKEEEHPADMWLSGKLRDAHVLQRYSEGGKNVCPWRSPVGVAVKREKSLPIKTLITIYLYQSDGGQNGLYGCLFSFHTQGDRPPGRECCSSGPHRPQMTIWSRLVGATSARYSSGQMKGTDI